MNVKNCGTVPHLQSAAPPSHPALLLLEKRLSPGSFSKHIAQRGAHPSPRMQGHICTSPGAESRWQAPTVQRANRLLVTSGYYSLILPGWKIQHCHCLSRLRKQVLYRPHRRKSDWYCCTPRSRGHTPSESQALPSKGPEHRETGLTWDFSGLRWLTTHSVLRCVLQVL